MTRTLTEQIPTAAEQPMTPILEGARAMGIKSNAKAYSMAEDGTFPVTVRKVGSRWMIPTTELRRFLGLDD